MQFHLVVVSAIMASSALAMPMPKPQLNLEGLKDIFLHDKREAKAAPEPVPQLDIANFLQEKDTDGGSSNSPNYDNMGSGGGLCLGSDNACVTGGGQITSD